LKYTTSHNNGLEIIPNDTGNSTIKTLMKGKEAVAQQLIFIGPLIKATVCGNVRL
jgi:hypothetical protein